MKQAYLDLWKPQIAAAHAEGREFVVGGEHSQPSVEGSFSHGVVEYNSVSCSGKQNVTDVFGQALWLVDSTSHYCRLAFKSHSSRSYHVRREHWHGAVAPAPRRHSSLPVEPTSEQVRPRTSLRYSR